MLFVIDPYLLKIMNKKKNNEEKVTTKLHILCKTLFLKVYDADIHTQNM